MWWRVISSRILSRLAWGFDDTDEARPGRLRCHPGSRAHLGRRPNTNWSKVDLEALRRHLIDMNEVTLKSMPSPTRSMAAWRSRYGHRPHAHRHPADDPGILSDSEWPQRVDCQNGDTAEW